MATKSIKQRAYISKIYTNVYDKVFLRENASLLPGEHVFFTYAPTSDAAYTRPEPRPHAFRIHLGGRMIAKIAQLPDKLYDKKTAKKFFVPTVWACKALYYHEMGHLRYTDMYSRDIVDYKEPKYANFLHTIFNIFEDIVIERYGMSVDFPRTKKYFQMTKKVLFLPSCGSYKDDPKSPSAFTNFLLLKLRCGKLFTGSSQIWEDHKKVLKPMAVSILKETDSHERLLKCIKFGEYLIKHTHLDFSTMEMDEESKVSGSMSSGPGEGSGGSGKSPYSTKSKKGDKKGKGTGSGEGESEEGESGEEKPSSDSEGESGGEGGSSSSGPAAPHKPSGRAVGSSGGSPEEAPDLKDVDELDKEAELDDTADVEDSYDEVNDLRIEDCDELEDSFNDVLFARDNHVFIDAKNYFDPQPSVIKAVNDRILKEGPLATQCKTALSVFQSRIRPRYQRHFKAGKLDIRTAMHNQLINGCDTKLFQKKVQNGSAPDLAISILCDNSGSMSGNKAHVCTDAMIALASACYMCNVPLEINTFTATSDCDSCLCYTTRIKKFEDDFNTIKPLLGITDSDYIHKYRYDSHIPTFAGNSDEVNLYYVWRDFRRNKHKDKLLIVISDGETCGSTMTLRKVVKDIKADGISIIGLGIQSRAVAGIYPEYRLFDSARSLESLPEFLTTTLLRFAKGGNR